MTGALLAAGAGLGFGAFQALNRRSVGGIADAYLATFLQLAVATAVLLAATLASADLSLLRTASAAALAWFVAAAVVHFLAGWTLLNMSQQRIGAARTSPLLATVPLFGAGVAALTLREAPRPLAWLGIVLIVAGATLVGVARSGRAAAVAPRDAAFGLGCALAWSISPVLIRKGLEGLASPLLGLTMGMVCVVLLYAAALPLLRRPERGRAATREALVFKLGAGVLVGLSTWARWAALDDTGVAVVLALGLLSVPVVLALSPLLVGRELEAVTPELLAAAALVVGGSLLLVGDA